MMTIIKTQIKILSLLFLISFAASSQTRVKAVLGELPDQMNVGGTYQWAVNITNTGSAVYTSDQLQATEDGEFTVTKNWTVEWKLAPGETTQVYYTITAPSTTGKHKLQIVVLNGEKRLATGTKMVKVDDARVPIK